MLKHTINAWGHRRANPHLMEAGFIGTHTPTRNGLFRGFVPLHRGEIEGSS